MALFSEADVTTWRQASRETRESLWHGLMTRMPATEASTVVQALLAQDWLQERRTSKQPEVATAMAWELHDWLVIAVSDNHAAWAHALLDEGVSPNLVLPDFSYGGGQALREAIDGRPFRDRPLDPSLVERLWRETDMAVMLRRLQFKLAKTTDDLFRGRYLHHLRQVVERTCQRPDLADLLAEMHAQFGDDSMPAYVAMRRAHSRQAGLTQRSAMPSPARRRS